MVLPITHYGNPVLRKECEPITRDYPGIEKLIDNMWDTLSKADGCGLAAPQVNHPICLFIVNSKDLFLEMDNDLRSTYFEENDKGIKEVFINSLIINYNQERIWTADEGCLSIPGMFEPVARPWQITIEYFDRNFEKQVRTFSGQTARIIQHEYDHTLGKLYIDYLNPLRKQLIRNKLNRLLKKYGGK